MGRGRKLGVGRASTAYGIAAAVLLLLIGSIEVAAFELQEFGLRVNIDRLATLASSTGKWHATLEAYLQTSLDSVWTMETGLGFDFARLAPSGTIGFQRDALTNMVLEADVVLAWIPRHGITATIDTGLRYHPTIAERTELIVETFPVEWQVISVDHRYIPIPQLKLNITLGTALLLQQGGFFGEAVTFEAYKIDARRLPFSLFVGNDWYLTAGEFSTRVGYRR